MGYECRVRDFSTKLGVAFFLLLVLAAVAVVNGTPFDVPGRTLVSQHKQMRYQPFSTLQTQQILAESGSFTFRVSSQNQTPQYFHATSFWVILVKSKANKFYKIFVTHMRMSVDVFHKFTQCTDPSCSSTLHHTCYLNVITSAFEKTKNRH